VKKTPLKSHNGLPNQERLEIEYQKAIEEERELNLDFNLDKLTKLGMRRYYSTLKRWSDFMDYKERELRLKEK